MATLAVGFLVGVGAVIAFLGRMDRERENGCFYTLILGLVLVAALAIAIGTTA
jgi:hypothetical protein